MSERFSFTRVFCWSFHPHVLSSLYTNMLNEIESNNDVPKRAREIHTQEICK